MVPGFDRVELVQRPAFFVENGLGWLGPHERLGRGVVPVQIVEDRGFEVGDAGIGAAPDALPRDLRKEPLDEIEP